MDVIQDLMSILQFCIAEYERVHSHILVSSTSATNLQVWLSTNTSGFIDGRFVL